MVSVVGSMDERSSRGLARHLGRLLSLRTRLLNTIDHGRCGANRWLSITLERSLTAEELAALEASLYESRRRALELIDVDDAILDLLLRAKLEEKQPKASTKLLFSLVRRGL